VSIVQVSDLVRIFFKHPLSYIPIVDENPGGDSYLIGFLSRQKVFHYSSDKERLENRFERIPDIFLSKEILPEHIWEFFEKSPIPVYNLFAQYLTTWDKHEINYYLKNFLFTVKSYNPKPIENQEELQNLTEKYHLLEMVFSSFPFPMLALDVEGNSIFYNELFLKDILDKGPFKKTLALAESYFKELIKDIIAYYILQNRPTDLMEWNGKEIKRKMIITNITEEKEIIGYLMIFLPYQESFSLEEYIYQELKKGLDYDSIIDNIETNIIKSFLDKNKQNITHTAEELRIKRTTLQNKIKRLNIHIIEEMVDHKKPSQNEEKQDRPKKSVSKKQKSSKNKIK
jgi:hypothetical protein